MDGAGPLGQIFSKNGEMDNEHLLYEAGDDVPQGVFQTQSMTAIRLGTTRDTFRGTGFTTSEIQRAYPMLHFNGMKPHDI